MAKIIKLTESDLVKIVKRVINEQQNNRMTPFKISFEGKQYTITDVYSESTNCYFSGKDLGNMMLRMECMGKGTYNGKEEIYLHTKQKGDIRQITLDRNQVSTLRNNCGACNENQQTQKQFKGQGYTPGMG